MIRRLTLAVACLIALSGCHSPNRDEGSSPATESTSDRAPQQVEPWYELAVREFQEADRANTPAPGQIVFTGSSSIRAWTTLEADMAPWPVLNRGFGGSKTGEVLIVMDRIVLAYEPGAIVYYCGDNDLAETNTDSAAAAQGFITFCERVHAERPGTPIFYISIKPSLARWGNWPAMKRANEMVAGYAATHDLVTYMDMSTCLLGPDGTPDPNMYVADGLHLSPAAYAKWTKIVREHVTPVAAAR
jgi:lysophospholipase L1-like esterase